MLTLEIATEQSKDPDAMKLPQGEKAIEYTGFLCTEIETSSLPDTGSQIFTELSNEAVASLSSLDGF